MSDYFGYNDYMASKAIEMFAYRESDKHLLDDPFYATLMACLKVAYSNNIGRLKQAFPEVVAEYYARYQAPHGLLPGEQTTDEDGTVVKRLETGEVFVKSAVG